MMPTRQQQQCDRQLALLILPGHPRPCFGVRGEPNHPLDVTRVSRPGRVRVSVCSVCEEDVRSAGLVVSPQHKQPLEQVAQSVPLYKLWSIKENIFLTSACCLGGRIMLTVQNYRKA